MNSGLDELQDLEYLFELSPDLLCVAGYDGYFKKINPAVSKTLGYTNEELFSKPINDFIYIGDKEITIKNRERIKNGLPLLNFENRYVTKKGEIVWLSWTSMPIERDQTVFAIAKNITLKKKEEQHRQINNHLNAENENDQLPTPDSSFHAEFRDISLSAADRAWLCEFDVLIKKYTGKIELSLSLLSSGMAISERQLHRRIKTIVGLTPNKYVRIIRLQLACEAIKTGKYRTIAEVSYAAGFETPAYFSKLFKEVYGYHVGELL